MHQLGVERLGRRFLERVDELFDLGIVPVDNIDRGAVEPFRQSVDGSAASVFRVFVSSKSGL